VTGIGIKSKTDCVEDRTEITIPTRLIKQMKGHRNQEKRNVDQIIFVTKLAVWHRHFQKVTPMGIISVENMDRIFITEIAIQTRLLRKVK
jgi:hypothetical protein